MQPLTAQLGRCPRQRHLGPAPRTGSTWGPGQCQVLGGTCPQSCALLVHSGHRPQVPITRLCPPSPGRPGSQTAPASTAAALPWAPCSSARLSAAHRSTRPSVPRSVQATSPYGTAGGQGYWLSWWWWRVGEAGCPCESLSGKVKYVRTWLLGRFNSVPPLSMSS